MKDLDKLFWNASVDEMSQGYAYDKETETYTCLICGQEYENGLIYPNGGLLEQAGRAIKSHISAEHSSMFEYLLGLDKQYTGLTDLQKQLLTCFRKGLSDKATVESIGGNSTSTIRNHRFKLKEREKQAKVFLAIMNNLCPGGNGEDELAPVPRRAKMVDDRYVVTEREREKIIGDFIAPDGRLSHLPAKEKKKIVVLSHIARRFEPHREYSAEEVDGILRSVHDDYVSIRRYLVAYGFLDRTTDNSRYWLKV